MKVSIEATADELLAPDGEKLRKALEGLLPGVDLSKGASTEHDEGPVSPVIAAALARARDEYTAMCAAIIEDVAEILEDKP